MTWLEGLKFFIFESLTWILQPFYEPLVFFCILLTDIIFVKISFICSICDRPQTLWETHLRLEINGKVLQASNNGMNPSPAFVAINLNPFSHSRRPKKSHDIAISLYQLKNFEVLFLSFSMVFLILCRWEHYAMTVIIPCFYPFKKLPTKCGTWSLIMVGTWLLTKSMHVIIDIHFI